VKRKFLLSIPFVLVGIIFFIAGLSPKPVQAAQQFQIDCTLDYVWREINSEKFVVLYTASQISMAQEIHENYIGQLEAEFAKYQKAFSSELPTPITIRIYPSEAEYSCLNALAPLITTEDSHTHIGTREIALIARAINSNPLNWENHAANALRHELAVLFAEHITNGNAPPGLLQGLGGYFEDPEQTFLDRYNASGGINQPDRGWQRLWEEDTSVSNASVYLQQTSTVAYLVDVFGWERFVDFLGKVAELQGYRQALVEVYEFNLQDLQNHWMVYYPVYIEARWQANVIHSFDLSQFQILITEGAYSDAEERLQEALSLIELFDSNEKYMEALLLLQRAEMGSEAAQLALQSRNAILGMDYGLGLTKAEQALSLYQQLGDLRRIPELESYKEISSEVLMLRAELEQLRGIGAPLDPVRTNRIVTIGRRLNELGDAEGANEVQLALLLLGSGQKTFVQWVTVIGLLLCVYIIWRRFIFVRKILPARVNLL